MDLGDSMGRAVQAAKRGDLDALEVELSELRAMPTASLTNLADRLRVMALCVRSHPSYDLSQAEAV